MPRQRKWLVFSALGVAGWCTLGSALMMAWATTAPDRKQAESAGVVIFLLVFFPSLIGAALGVGSMDKRLGNPPIVWIAALWNGLIAAGFVGLVLLGLLLKA